MRRYRPPAQSIEVRRTLFVFAWTRAATWLGALFALLVFLPNGNPNAIHRDDPTLIHDLGRFTDVWARWDSVWFIRIAHHGYDVAAGAPAFYPLYPALVAAVGRVVGGHYVLGGIIVSLAAAAAAFVLLAQLAEQLVGADAARRTVLLLAVFPMALFLQAVYSESVFLLAAVAAFLAAERGRFVWAGLLTGAAMLARPTGVAVLVGVAVLALQGEDRLRRVGSVLLALPVFALFPLWLWIDTGHPFAFLHVEQLWHRRTATLGPIGGLAEAAHAAWAGILQLTVGSNTHWYWVQQSPDRAAAINLESTAFLILYVGLAVVAWRRLGAAYGLMSLIAVLAPTATPTHAYPLLSMPRFGLVAFPIFIALGAVCERPDVERVVIAVSGILLGVATVQWALWQWVS